MQTCNISPLNNGEAFADVDAEGCEWKSHVTRYTNTSVWADALLLPNTRPLLQLQINTTCDFSRGGAIKCLDSPSSSEGGGSPQQLAETGATANRPQRLWGRISSSQPAALSRKSPQVEAGMQLEKSNAERRLPSVPEAVKTLTRPWFRQGFEQTTSHGEQKWYCNHIQTARHHRCHSSSDAKTLPPVNNGCFKVGRISVTLLTLFPFRSRKSPHCFILSFYTFISAVSTCWLLPGISVLKFQEEGRP